MARAGPRKVLRYGERFKATTVKLSNLSAVLIQDVRAHWTFTPSCSRFGDFAGDLEFFIRRPAPDVMRQRVTCKHDASKQRQNCRSCVLYRTCSHVPSSVSIVDLFRSLFEVIRTRAFRDEYVQYARLSLLTFSTCSFSVQ